MCREQTDKRTCMPAYVHVDIETYTSHSARVDYSVRQRCMYACMHVRCLYVFDPLCFFVLAHGFLSCMFRVFSSFWFRGGCGVGWGARLASVNIINIITIIIVIMVACVSKLFVFLLPSPFVCLYACLLACMSESMHVCMCACAYLGVMHVRIYAWM